jgi:hypothetical protein
MEMERAGLQERADGKMARALDHPTEGETWEELKHIAWNNKVPSGWKAVFYRMVIPMRCIS